MPNIHAGGLTRKEYTNISSDRIIYLSFDEQAVCETGTKWKKVLLDKCR